MTKRKTNKKRGRLPEAARKHIIERYRYYLKKNLPNVKIMRMHMVDSTGRVIAHLRSRGRVLDNTVTFKGLQEPGVRFDILKRKLATPGQLPPIKGE